MADEQATLYFSQQYSLKSEIIKKIDQKFLQQIIDNSYDAIFVTDQFGNVLLANSGAQEFMGLQPEELIGSNVQDLVNMGIYNWSPTLQAIKTRSTVMGIVKNTRGAHEKMVTSKPLIDEYGNLVMVITNVRDSEMVEKYNEELARERANVKLYKSAVKYLSEIEIKNKEIVAESRQMREILITCNTIAKTDSTILLIGDTGTGKEVIARYIHENSLRFKEPFIPVNCAAIPHELLESEFFGYVRGAFSGANPQGKPGLFEIADKGTLFLDEIGELPMSMQSKLLRVIESSEVMRLGDTNIYQTNIRVIAATNRDLKAMISQKLFRSDLYYRLNVIPINLPSLKDRPEDILALADKFLQELNKKYAFKKTFSPHATQAFLNYSWPGNVRELRNIIERLVITSSGEVLDFDDGILVTARKPPETNQSSLHEECLKKSKTIHCQGTLKSVLKDVEAMYIQQILNECGGRIGETARILGIHRTMLYRKIVRRS